MSDLFVTTVTGRLTQDAQFKTLPTGTSLLELNIAVNTGYKDRQKTTYIKIKKWGESGRNICQYLTKGTFIGASGELSVNEWTGNDGTKRTSIELDARGELQMLGSKRKESNTEHQAYSDDEPVF